MSGHSKWSTIKHKKAAIDAKRGKHWSKIARDITIAAKFGGGDPDSNPRLRLCMDKARAANMPKDNVERAVKKGTGELEGETYEEIVYEGYGPGGVAVMCRTLTDNRTRTAPEIKKVFERHGGNLGTPNSVGWMFKSRGVIIVGAESVSEEKILELGLEAGADDVSSSALCHEITTAPDAYLQVKAALEAAGIEIQSSEVTMVASNTIAAKDVDTAGKVMKLLDALEDHDDVQSVSSNVDIPDDIAAQLA